MFSVSIHPSDQNTHIEELLGDLSFFSLLCTNFVPVRAGGQKTIVFKAGELFFSLPSHWNFKAIVRSTSSMSMMTEWRWRVSSHVSTVSHIQQSFVSFCIWFHTGAGWCAGWTFTPVWRWIIHLPAWVGSMLWPSLTAFEWNRDQRWCCWEETTINLRYWFDVSS